MMDQEAKLYVFQELLSCSGVLLWHYDREMTLLSGTEEDSPLAFLFGAWGGKQMIRQHCFNHKLPGFCADEASLQWLAVPQYTDQVLTDIYILGPVFGSASSEGTVRSTLHRLHVPDSQMREMANTLQKIPVVHSTLLIQYGILLCRYLTGTECDETDFQVITGGTPQHMDSGSSERPLFSRNGTYAMEQELFKAVEEGNLAYQHPPQALARQSGSLSRGDPLRHAKNQTIACITLLTRAAIRGGLPENIAYSLSDWYIQMMETLSNIADVYQLSRDAFADFTRRVHKRRASGYSREIQECMSYIGLHFQEELTLESLARELGYSKSHLSAKFSKETGISISDYTVQVKIEYAKLWLRNSDKSIREISNDLNYGSISYFSAVFKKHTGITPSMFRNQT